jgi:hypothetical protein
MTRNARARAARRNIWTQVGVSACVLLLPPMALGAAVYAMLPARDDGAVRPLAANAVVDAHAAAADVRLAAVDTWPARAEPQPVAAAPQPAPATAKPAPTAKSPYALASAHQERAEKTLAKENGKETVKEAARETAKDPARVLGPVPVHVTVVVPPPAAAPAATANADSTPTGSISPEPARTAAAEVPAIVPPPAQIPPAPESFAHEPATLGLAAQVPATEPPLAEAPPGPSTATTTRRHGRFSYLRHLARRTGARAEALSEARAARANAQPPQSFSLRNWLLGSSRPRS